MILEKGMFGKRVVLIEKGKSICLKSFLRMKGMHNNRDLLDFSKREH